MTVYASNAERPVVGLQYVPDSMETRGIITPISTGAAGIRNGDNLLVNVGLPGFTWQFNTMTPAELQWWLDLVGYNYLSDTPLSKRFVKTGLMPAFRLWTRAITINNYAAGVLDVPTWGRYQNGKIHDVTVTITALVADI